MGTEVATAMFQHSEPLFVATNKYKPTEDTPTPKQGCCTHSLKLIPTSDSSQAAKRSMHLPDSDCSSTLRYFELQLQDFAPIAV